MAELNGTAAFEMELLQAIREDAFSRGFTGGVCSVLVTVTEKGVEAALKDAKDFIHGDNANKEVVAMYEGGINDN